MLEKKQRYLRMPLRRLVVDLGLEGTVERGLLAHQPLAPSKGQKWRSRKLLQRREQHRGHRMGEG